MSWGVQSVALTTYSAASFFWLLTVDRSGPPAPGTSFADADPIDPSDLDAGWLGLRASGEWRPAAGALLIYWADAALLRGNEDLTPFQAAGDAGPVAGASTRRRVHAHAVDLGLIAALPWPGRPSVTAGYARGSGGARSATEDANFRQTGLQENKQRLGGVKRWRIYGELLQPELSNLAVATLAGGVRGPLPGSWKPLRIPGLSGKLSQGAA